MMTIRELNAKLAGSRGLQVCFGENEVIIRMEDGIGISIERNIDVDHGNGWVRAQPTNIVATCLSVFISIDMQDSEFVLAFEHGKLRFETSNRGFESIVIFDGNPSRALFVK